jgi:hypothetical protein
MALQDVGNICDQIDKKIKIWDAIEVFSNKRTPIYSRNLGTC